MKSLGGMAPDERKAAGAALNALKGELATAIDEKSKVLESAALNARLGDEAVDVTLPVRPDGQGAIHPISQTIDEVIAILGEMGLSVAEGSDIESDWYNFTALNIPPEHPARQEHDTFYLPGTSDDGQRQHERHPSPVERHLSLPRQRRDLGE